MKHFTHRLVCPALALALALPLAGCAAKTEETVMDPTVTVETTAAKRGSLSTDSTYIGSISAEGTAAMTRTVLMMNGSKALTAR